MKKYASKTCIAFNVLIKGKRKHISFEPVTSGGSTFQTSDEELQKVMEETSLFKNKEFCIVKETKPVAKPITKPVEKKSADTINDNSSSGNTRTDSNVSENSSSNSSGDSVGGNNETGAGIVVVPEISNSADAKAFLVEKGAKASVLTSKVKIREAAASLGYAFPNLN